MKGRTLSLFALMCLACSAGTAAQEVKDSPPTDGGPVPIGDPNDPSFDGGSDGASWGDSVSQTVDSSAPPVPCGSPGAPLCSLWEKCTDSMECAIGTRCSQHTKTCLARNSCTGGVGADRKCAGGDCCETIPVPGGTFENVDNDVDVETAFVPPYGLDKFEITVGRFRAFVNAFDGNLRGNPPAPGAGAKASVPGSGWRSSFNARLPGSRLEINERLTWGCAVGGNNEDFGAATWTPEPGPNEDKPIDCIDWYTIFAFCAWDGGRLPTDAEWSFVALSGNEKRIYPFGNTVPTWTTHLLVFASRLPEPTIGGTTLFTQGPQYREANHGPLPIAPVGLKTERSAWGHADVTGNVIEQTMEKAQALPANCNDCANVSWPDPPQTSGYPRDWKLPGSDFSDAAAANDGIRLARGSSWQGEQGGHWMKNTRNRFWLPVWRTYSAMGGRCARDL